MARVLDLSEWKVLTRILLPAVLPYMLTGVRLSIGIAWLVIVAAEMLTGGVGIGFWIWDEWNNLNVRHIIIAIFVIGVVGLLLEGVDRYCAPLRICALIGGDELRLDQIARDRRPRRTISAGSWRRDHVCDQARAVVALRDIDLTIARGEFVSLIGHSGCGKSTLPESGCGPAAADARRWCLAEREISGPGPDRAVIFQGHSLLPWMSCFDNVHLAVERVFAATESKAC